jgi:hypothetical protein
MEIAMTRSKWFLPLFAVLLGFAMFVAEWIGGHPLDGLYAGAVIVGFGLVVLLGGIRSETIRGLRGDGKDERFHRIDTAATALAGSVLIGTVIIAWMIEVARGNSGSPYGWLGAIAGLTYLGAIGFMRWRR